MNEDAIVDEHMCAWLAVLAASAFDCSGVAIDHPSRGYGRTVKQANKTKQTKTKEKSFFFFIIRNRDKIKEIAKIEILIITSRKIKSI